MIYIGYDEDKILNAKNKHIERASIFVNERKNNIINNLQGTPNLTDEQRNNLDKCLSDVKIRSILNVNPNDNPIKIKRLITINAILSNINHETINYLFDYSNFMNRQIQNIKYSYLLAQDLDIRVCPYCNRNYTLTVITEDNENVIRPQFDHYLPQSKYPILALSFFNLIPSCSSCNQLKRDHDTLKNPIINPYEAPGENQLTFTYFPEIINGRIENRVQVLTVGQQAAQSKIVFKLEEVYNGHKTELDDWLKLAEYYPEFYLADLMKQVGIKTMQEAYRLLFGVEYDLENYTNRPFSKMKNDIFIELGLREPHH